MNVIDDNGIIMIAGREVRTADARKMMRKLRDKKNACVSKLDKTDNRVAILDRFINDAKGTDVNLATWMQSKGLDYKKFFASLGYYTPLQKVVSDDAENTALVYHREMIYNPQAGYFLPSRKVVSTAHHNTMVNSKLGMTYDAALGLYFPTTVYDSDAFSSAEGTGDHAIDIMGGFTLDDIGNLNVSNEDSEELTLTVKDLLEEEYDNVDEELEIIEQAEYEMFGNNFSNIDGDDEKAKSGRNATCRTGCALKHPFNKGKRTDCNEDCDEKFKPSLKQESKREDREDRQDARIEKREAKKDCKDQLKAGEIDIYTYKRCRSAERFKMRESIKEAGGNLLYRFRSKVSKVMPIVSLSRGGVLILSKANAFGFATRLAPALLPIEQAKLKFKASSIPRAEVAWKKASHVWKGIGGNPDKLKEAIIIGYNKKPMKVSRKALKQEANSGFDGFDDNQEYEYTFTYDGTIKEQYSNIEAVSGIAIAGAVTAGLSALSGLIVSINKAGADKNPFPENATPIDYQNALNDGVINELPEPEPNEPQYNPTTDNWVDPSTGRAIDPQTGEFLDDKILGMNKWLALGLGIFLVVGIGFLATRKGKGKK